MDINKSISDCSSSSSSEEIILKENIPKRCPKWCKKSYQMKVPKSKTAARLKQAKKDGKDIKSIIWL